MDWQEIHRQLLTTLHGEVRGHWGRISEIEEGLGLSDGYLSKLCGGKIDFKLELFLKTIAALELDPKRFFARVLESPLRPEECLEQFEDSRENDLTFSRIARATVELEAAEPPPACRKATAGAANVAAFASRPRKEQLRRLRHTPKYRTHAFARAYLEHLDALRYDHAALAARLVTGVAVHLIPALPGPRRERLALQCLALGVFGSARRSKGRFSSAARALRLGLELSRRAKLSADTANLLIRASYLLKDAGYFERALALLNEALVVFVQLGSRQDMGRVLVDQGMILTALGDHEAAVLDLEQALRHLGGSTTASPRSHLAAYQNLAYAFEQLGDFGTAEKWLAKGMRAFGKGHAVDQAKLRWSQGTLAFRRGEYRRAEDFLRTARTVLASRENALQEAVVTLDLLLALLAQGKTREATATATAMAPLLLEFKNNRFAEAALLELINTALAGELSDEAIHRARTKVEEQAPAKGRALRR